MSYLEVFLSLVDMVLVGGYNSESRPNPLGNSWKKVSFGESSPTDDLIFIFKRRNEIEISIYA